MEDIINITKMTKYNYIRKNKGLLPSEARGREARGKKQEVKRLRSKEVKK
jgi:hypothetical protein